MKNDDGREGRVKPDMGHGAAPLARGVSSSHTRRSAVKFPMHRTPDVHA